MSDDDDRSKPWWQNPAVVAAVITGVFGIIAIVVTQAVRGDGDGDHAGPSVRGVEAVLHSEVGQFNLRCPTTITFKGEITASEGSGDVAYRFVHIDAVGGTEQLEALRTVSFTGPGTSPVRYEWTPSIPQGEVFRTVAIVIVSPVSTRSNEVTVTGRCDASLPEGPPTPPPDVQPPGG